MYYRLSGSLYYPLSPTINTITINRNYTFINGHYPNELISAFKSKKTNLSCGFRRSTEWKIACCQSLRWEAHAFGFLPVVNFGVIGRSMKQQAVYLNLSRYFICNCCAHKARFGSDLEFYRHGYTWDQIVSSLGIRCILSALVFKKLLKYEAVSIERFPYSILALFHREISTNLLTLRETAYQLKPEQSRHLFLYFQWLFRYNTWCLFDTPSHQIHSSPNDIHQWWVNLVFNMLISSNFHRTNLIVLTMYKFD